MEARAVPSKIDEREWAEACRRDEMICRLIDEASGGRVGREAVAKAAASLDISTPTLYRLIGRFRKERRVSALLRGKRGRPIGTQAISEAVEAIIQAAIKEVYLVPERPPFQELVKHVAVRCRAQKERVPAAATIKRRVDRIDPERRARLRHDEASVEAMKATPGKLEVERPLDFVQVDHTLTDLIVVDEETRQFIGRPWLTLAIDVFTRMVTGFSLSFEPPQRTSVGLCLLHSVYDKTSWLQSLGIDTPWPVAGLPRRLGVDNAAEFVSADFRAACREFGIKLEHRPLGKKHFGGHIEQLIGTQMGAVHLLPGTTQRSIKERQNYNSQDAAALTMKELETWLALEIAGKYHQAIHSALLRPPIAVWREWDDKVPLEMPVDRLGFWVSFLPSEQRSLRRDGIHLFKIQYWSDALRGDVGRTKGLLTIKYDPRNISRIFVQRENGHWVEARYRNLRRPAISLWEYRGARRRLNALGRSEVNEEIIFQTILQQREIVAKARKHKASARLAQARQAPELARPKQVSRLTGIDLRPEASKRKPETTDE